MALTTLHSSTTGKWSVEEDAHGQLWLEVATGGHGIVVLHYELNPGEAKQFRLDPDTVANVARRIAAKPTQYLSKQSEIAYRKAAGAGI
jgi:hypothetical protein